MIIAAVPTGSIDVKKKKKKYTENKEEILLTKVTITIKTQK